MKRIIPAAAVLLSALFFSSTGFAQSDPAARQAEMKQN
jgi:hypothetical protein